MESFEDKRTQFRVDLVRPVKGTAELVSINGQRSHLKKNLPLSILDLSAGGMNVETPLDLPINVKMVFRVSFEFDDEPFEVSSELIRKNDYGDKKEYGAKFIDLSSKDEQRLVMCLNHYKIRQSKEQKILEKNTELEEIHLLSKMLEALPGPAFIINKRRVILGLNTLAKNFGVRLGGRCHMAVGKSKRKCRCCRLEYARKVTRIIEEETVVFDGKYRASWLYLDYGLCLHYFTKL
jgi:hypothetical protein